MAQGRTDHSKAIAAIRKRIQQDVDVMANPAFMATSTGKMEYELVILAAAADLLQAHDDTGLSLDNWAGPLALVQLALQIAGEYHSRPKRLTFQPNNA